MTDRLPEPSPGLSTDALLEAFGLPAESRVRRRIAKTFVAEHGAANAADRRLVRDAIEALYVRAVLKPASCGVPAEGVYDEIVVLALTLRCPTPAQRARLLALVHRAVQYPVVLLVDHAGSEAAEGPAAAVSLAPKRAAAREADRLVLERPPLEASATPDLLAALPLAGQPRTSLRALYAAWEDALLAALAAEVTGTFRLVMRDPAPPDAAPEAAERPEPPAAPPDRLAALEALRDVEAQIARVTREARRASQLRHRADLNRRLQRLRADRDRLRQRLA